MNTECPTCGQRYELDNSTAGKTVECECGEQWQTKEMPILLSTQNREQEKSRLTYILLGLFFGCFGAHNFYSGHKGDGRLKLYLLFLPVVGWFISGCLSVWEICTVTKDSKGVPLK